MTATVDVRRGAPATELELGGALARAGVTHGIDPGALAAVALALRDPDLVERS